MQVLFFTMFVGAAVWLLCARVTDRATRSVLATPTGPTEGLAADVDAPEGPVGAGEVVGGAAQDPVPDRRAAAPGTAEQRTARRGGAAPRDRVVPRAPVPRTVRVLSELSGTLMSSRGVAGGAVSVEVLAVAGSGQFAGVRPGEFVSVICDASTYAQARMAGVEPLGEVTLRMSSVPVPGEVFSGRRVEILPVAAPS